MDKFMSPHPSEFHSFFSILEAERFSLIHMSFLLQTGSGNLGKIISLLITTVASVIR